MCPARMQTQYDLTENTTPVSTRALLLVLENIKNNADLDNKSQNPNKPKEAEGKCKMDLAFSRKPARGWSTGSCQRNKGRSTVCYARSMEGHSKATAYKTVVVITKAAPQSRIMGAQVGLSLPRRGPRM